MGDSNLGRMVPEPLYDVGPQPSSRQCAGVVGVPQSPEELDLLGGVGGAFEHVLHVIFIVLCDKCDKRDCLERCCRRLLTASRDLHSRPSDLA